MILLPIRAAQIAAVRALAVDTDDAATVRACDDAAQYLARVARGVAPTAAQVAGATLVLREVVLRAWLSAQVPAPHGAAKGGA